MGLFSKDIKTMDDLFLHVLQDIYYAENQIVKSLPDMIEKAIASALAKGLRTADIESEGSKVVSTSEMGAAIIAEMERLVA